MLCADISELLHKLLWRIKSKESCKERVGREKPSLWGGLEDAFYCIFKKGAVLLFDLFQGLLGP